MPEYTSKLSLVKPTEPESADINKINSNMDRLDRYAGVYECTSTTRPVGTDRFIGAVIFETDTGFTLIWNGTRWIGRPYHIERFRTGVSGSVSAATWEAIQMQGTRNASHPITGTFEDWGLTSFTEAAIDITLPVQGLWLFQTEISTVGVSVKLPRFRIEVDPANQPGAYKYLQGTTSGSNSNSGASSGVSYHIKGAKVRVEVNIPSGATGNMLAIANDVISNSGTRTYLSATLLSEAV